MHDSDEATTYRLGASKAGVALSFTPSGHDLNRTWQMDVSVRGRGGKLVASLVQTTALRPLGTVTIKQNSYPLTIGWHERKRGGMVCFGGERKLGAELGTLSWEMHWRPDASSQEQCIVELRILTTPRRSGDLNLSLYLPLHRPEIWSLGAAAANGHCAQLAYSAYSGYAVQFVTLEGEAGWGEQSSAFELACRKFSFGGGKTLRFGVGCMPAADCEDARASLVMQYAALSSKLLHPLADLPALGAAAAAAALADPASYAVRGAERLYLRIPGECTDAPEAFYGGFPHYPLDALRALWDWNRFHPAAETPRLVRYGAAGIATDFQVMGKGELPEPNKGAFWDKVVDGAGMDFAGDATHGIASNARIAQGLFGLHEALGAPLLRQSALNICQWLILKMNDAGYFDGERVQATRELPDDGRVIKKACSLAGAEAIRPFVSAFRATKSEVFIKAAWKIANYLLATRLREFENANPAAIASVALALAALDSEAPNPKIRAGLQSWGSWLRAVPLLPDSPVLNPDGRYSGFYDCALAGFAFYVLFRDAAYLRYAFSALGAIPSEARAKSWRELAVHAPALLSIAAFIPEALPSFDTLSVALDWRVYAPDPATDEYIRLITPNDGPVHYLPLVSRQDDQLLLLILAPRETECVSIFKNGRRPLVRDLLAGTLDSDAPLHPLGDESWARIGIFTIDP